MSRVKKKVKLRAYRRAVEDLLRKKRSGEDIYTEEEV